MKYKNLTINPKMFFYWGIFILLFIFSNILISSIFLIIKMSINIFIPIISFIISIIIYLFLLKKENDISKKYKIISLLIPITLIIITTLLCSFIYDYSYDGNNYHKTSIGMLMDGWNPVYESLEEFNQSLDKPLIINDQDMYLWCNHYAKASYFYAASIGKITGSIESGKSINLLTAIMFFCFVFAYILNIKKEYLSSFLISLSFTSMPTIVNQLSTYYVDGLLYVFFFLIIFFFFLNEKDKLIKNKNLFLFMYAMILIISINIKFSLFAYTGIYCLGYYIWYIIRYITNKIDRKCFWKFTAISLISVLIAIFVVGLSVYPKNYLKYHHPFYPLMGENKVDIMTHNEPTSFHNMSNIKKFFISTFSQVANVDNSSKTLPTLKIPFMIYKNEIHNVSCYDTRISGNGLFFSGILIISLIILIINLFKIFKKDKTLFCLMIIPLSITLIMIIFFGESWWARYFPQIHLIILFSIIILLINKSKILDYIVLIILLNNIICFGGVINKTFNYTVKANNGFKEFKMNHSKDECTLLLYTYNFPGAYYDIREKLKEYDYEYLKQYDNSPYYFMDKIVYWRCKNEKIFKIVTS